MVQTVPIKEIDLFTSVNISGLSPSDQQDYLTVWDIGKCRHFQSNFFGDEGLDSEREMVHCLFFLIKKGWGTSLGGM